MLVQNKVLKVVSIFNYLGVNIDSCLSFAPQGKKILGMTAGKLSQLRHIRKSVDRDTSLLVYKQMIRPVMEYSSFMVDGAPEWVPRKFQVSQNDCLRVCEKIKNAQDVDLDLLHLNCDIEWLDERRDKALLAIM